MNAEQQLAFWCKQLATLGNSWRERFADWQCTPGDERWDSVAQATERAREWANAAGFTARPVAEQTAIVVCLSQSERLEDQALALALSSSLGDSELTKHLLARHEVIRQYRRFPARNRLLGRGSTPAEAYFLTTAGQQYR